MLNKNNKSLKESVEKHKSLLVAANRVIQVPRSEILLTATHLALDEDKVYRPVLVTEINRVTDTCTASFIATDPPNVDKEQQYSLLITFDPKHMDSEKSTVDSKTFSFLHDHDVNPETKQSHDAKTHHKLTPQSPLIKNPHDPTIKSPLNPETTDDNKMKNKSETYKIGLIDDTDKTKHLYLSTKSKLYRSCIQISSYEDEGKQMAVIKFPRCGKTQTVHMNELIAFDPDKVDTDCSDQINDDDDDDSNILDDKNDDIKKEVRFDIPNKTDNPFAGKFAKATFGVIKYILNQVETGELPEEDAVNYIKNGVCNIPGFLQHKSTPPATSTIKTEENPQDNNYTQQLLQEARIKTSIFNQKWPTNPNEFYQFITALDEYYISHPLINKDRIFQAVLEGIPKIERQTFRLYVAAKRDKMIRMEGKENNLGTKHEISKSLNNRDELEKWIIITLRICPHITEFEKQLICINAQFNEHPVDLIKRCKRHFNECNSVITRINKARPDQNPIPQISEEDKLKTIYRVYVLENAEDEYRNNGHLNRKIRTQIAKYWEKHAKTEITMIAVTNYCIQIGNQLIPAHAANKDPSKNWHKYNSRKTIFQYRSFHKRRINKDKDRDDKAGQPQTKRQKTDRDKAQFNENIKCKNGRNCKYFIQNGSCKFRHNRHQLIELSKKYKQNPDPSMIRNPRKLNKREYETQKYNKNQSKYKNNDCKYGATCNDYQQGTCHRNHPGGIPCGWCGRLYHIKAKCRNRLRAEGANSSDTTTTRNNPYNPQSNPNPEAAKRNISSSNTRLMVQIPNIPDNPPNADTSDAIDHINNLSMQQVQLLRLSVGAQYQTIKNEIENRNKQCPRKGRKG